MDVFKETGSTKRDCGEDDFTDISDTETVIGSTCGGSSSDDAEWVDEELGNHQEQSATIIQHVGSTGISVEDIQKQLGTNPESSRNKSRTFSDIFRNLFGKIWKTCRY